MALSLSSSRAVLNNVRAGFNKNQKTAVRGVVVVPRVASSVEHTLLDADVTNDKLVTPHNVQLFCGRLAMRCAEKGICCV